MIIWVKVYHLLCRKPIWCHGGKGQKLNRYRLSRTLKYSPINAWIDRASEGRRHSVVRELLSSIVPSLVSLNRTPVAVSSNLKPFLFSKSFRWSGGLFSPGSWCWEAKQSARWAEYKPEMAALLWIWYASKLWCCLVSCMLKYPVSLCPVDFGKLATSIVTVLPAACSSLNSW